MALIGDILAFLKFLLLLLLVHYTTGRRGGNGWDPRGSDWQKENGAMT